MEKKYSVLIVEDELLARQRLKKLLAPYADQLEIIGEAVNGEDGLQKIEALQPEFIFLDIQMPLLNGFDMLQKLSYQPNIIFTTAFDQYALEGIKVEAIDYLLKPFDYAEFLAAANKANTYFELVKGNNKPPQPSIVSEEKEFLFVKSEYKQLRIKLADVLYFEGLKDYIKIWLKDNPKPILTLMSLKSLQEELPEAYFMRVHRSFIVSLKNIEVIERSQIIINNKRITISEQYKPKFLEFVNSNSLT